ncbi:MAG: 50S ribosomal protein L3 [Planctomycetes bacterium]|nr:50S ribosomal protein L3 [Planctomycetota bacterium]
MSLTQLIGTKREMSQIFNDDGTVVPVTIVEVGPCTVTQVKTSENDGYDAVQIGYGDIRLSRVSKPLKGHFKKAGVEPRRRLQEIKLSAAATQKAGDVVKVAEVFKQGDWVDVIGTSKGRGFQGGVKRHGFGGGPAAHGTKNMREPGSSGTNTNIGYVRKGKRMAGHMGVERITVRNLLVARVDGERNLIFLRGAVPGFNGAFITVRKAKAKTFAKADRALRKAAAK